MFPLEARTQELRNRTRIEILSSILEVAGRGTLKTHIMYKANLSHKQLQKYMIFLQGNGLLGEVSDEETGNRVYRVTERGCDFLREYSHLSDYLAENVAARS